MAFYYFSIDFFWLLFTSVLAPFALALLIVSLLVSADQSDGSRETGFGQEKRVEFVRKVETFADSGEKLAECKAPVDGSSRFLQMAEEVAEDEPIEENPVVGEAGAGGFLGTATDSARDETGLIENGEVSVPDDDWEGVERTELERVFAAAVSFVGSKRNADRISKLGRDLAAEMFGLHKIATVGPCCEPQPMVFKASARAKWNAWRRLGNMNQETAMERYIELLSGSIPWWLQDDGDGDNKWDHTEIFTVSANQPIAADWRSLNELKENFYLTKSSTQILETPTKVMEQC